MRATPRKLRWVSGPETERLTPSLLTFSGILAEDESVPERGDLVEIQRAAMRVIRVGYYRGAEGRRTRVVLDVVPRAW
jgi:hypothetical protein